MVLWAENPTLYNFFKIIICNSFLSYIFAALITKERRLLPMLIIPIKEGENIDRALKRFKRKFDKTGTMRQLRKRRSEEHTSELQSRENLVCRLLLEKKN